MRTVSQAVCAECKDVALRQWHQHDRISVVCVSKNTPAVIIIIIIIIKQENNEWRIVKEAVKLLHAFKDLKAKVKYHHQCQGLKSLRTDSGYRSVSSEREWVIVFTRNRSDGMTYLWPVSLLYQFHYERKYLSTAV